MTIYTLLLQPLHKQSPLIHKNLPRTKPQVMFPLLLSLLDITPGITVV